MKELPLARISSVQKEKPLVSKHGIALVSMPWAFAPKPSLALAILKPCIEEAGFTTDIYHFNLKFAMQIGMNNYKAIAGAAHNFELEWLFSQYLFGSQGLNEIANDWNILKTNPEAGPLLNDLRESCGGSEELCERIAKIEIPKFMDECLNQVKWSEYMAIGFTTTFAQSLASLALAKRIKDISPDVKVIFGGANVESEMGVEFIRGFPWVDYVVHGEGEQSLPELLTQIAGGGDGKRVPGVSMRQGGEVIAGDGDAKPLSNMNESPMPDYSDYIRTIQDLGINKKYPIKLLIESSRGCWWGAKHHCTFCGLNTTTMTHRKKDADRVYKEIIKLSEKHRCLNFETTDNIIAMEYFKDLLPRLADEDIDLELFYEVKANLSKEQLRLMRAAGVKSIQPGIESFNSKILKLMRKGTTAIQNIQLLKWCNEYNIRPGYNIIYGFPGESVNDYADIPQIFRLISHLRPPAFLARLVYQRFSPYYFESEKFGLKLRPWPGYKFIFPEQRINFSRIAYLFESEYRPDVDPAEYIEPIQRAWRIWKTLSKQQNIICYYEKGPTYLLIHDNRYLQENVDQDDINNIDLKYRKLLLSEPLASIYLFCDEYHSFKTICRMVEGKFPGTATEIQIDAWLSQLVARGLMFKEEDKYLSLAVRKQNL